MQVHLLIEPKDGGGFRATAGEPFRITVEAGSEEDAANQLGAMLRSRLKGTRVVTLDLDNGFKQDLATPARLEPISDEDWFFQTMRDAIEENRKRENEAET